MKTFKIIRPDENIRPALIDKINNLTKPKGSLGTLEDLAFANRLDTTNSVSLPCNIHRI